MAPACFAVHRRFSLLQPRPKPTDRLVTSFHHSNHFGYCDLPIAATGPVFSSSFLFSVVLMSPQMWSFAVSRIIDTTGSCQQDIDELHSLP